MSKFKDLKAVDDQLEAILGLEQSLSALRRLVRETLIPRIEKLEAGRKKKLEAGRKICPPASFQSTTSPESNS
jgi:hypothetical protein